LVGPWPVVREGNRDSEESNGVYKVQRLLRHHAFDVAADHIFGPATAGAVRAFQEDRGLDADGIVGDQTWTRMIVQVREGDAGEAVFALQSQWRFINHDGVFGPKTDALVRDFQQREGLDVDGIVGPQTWQRMGNGPIIDAPEHLRHDAT
jgi:peptidoglycan hydrolase-like protein with peptidoglycan-binding domain